MKNWTIQRIKRNQSWIFSEKKHMTMNKKNAKTGAGLRANPAFGPDPKAVPRPSHGQARMALHDRL